MNIIELAKKALKVKETQKNQIVEKSIYVLGMKEKILFEPEERKLFLDTFRETFTLDDRNLYNNNGDYKKEPALWVLYFIFVEDMLGITKKDVDAVEKSKKLKTVNTRALQF